MIRKVLIVDDQADEAEALIQHLRSEGFGVLLAASGREALALILSGKPDAIVCDLEMPEIDGYDLLEAVALDPATHDLPFALANPEWNWGNWSRSRGGRTADCHFLKPYHCKEVACFLTRLLRSTGRERKTD